MTKRFTDITSAKEVHNIFPNLEDALIDEITQKARLKHIPAGSILVNTGQVMNNTLLVANGLVKVYREDQEGNEYFMYHLHQGQACALTINCAIRQENSPVMAKAVQDTDLIILPISDIDRWMREYKSWNSFVLDSYRERYMDIVRTLDQVAFRNMDDRILFYLKRHQKELGGNDIRITHQQIATELNSSREVISRLLKKMADEGKIVLHRYHIEILDLDK